MKQCPVCEKTFEDNMRFCQADGTALVDKAEPVDPYKTMVASKEEIAAAMRPPASEEKPAVPEPSVPAPIENQVLEIPPKHDPNKTQVVSEEELRAEMAKAEAEDNVIDVPPAPKSDGPGADKPSSASPPPSPFAASSEGKEEPAPGFLSSPAIPSPFNAKPAGSTPEPIKDSPKPQEPSMPQFATPVKEKEPSVNPFEKSAAAAPMAQAGSSPPAQSNMQNPQDFGQNAPYNAPPAAGGGQSSVLAIVSLVLGILSLLCCNWYIVGLAAIILGFVARSKANNDPANYGGAGLALGGIIVGILSLFLGTVIWILFLFTNVFAGVMGNNF